MFSSYKEILGGGAGYLMEASLTPTVPNDQQLMGLQIAEAKWRYLQKPWKNYKISAMKFLTNIRFFVFPFLPYRGVE